MTFSYAVGEQQTAILMTVAELGFGITDRLAVSLRLPYQWADGNLGRNSGMGDPVITASYAISAKTYRRLDAMLGVKLNAGNANASTVEGFPLPMPYQTSLGTTDLLMGLNYRNGRWRGALALQTVLVNENTNTFTHAAWMDDPMAQGYFESAYLERAADAVARIQYAVPIGSLVVQPGLLAIYHVARDKRQEVPMDPAGMPRLPEVVEIVGSEGLTLNLTVDARYTLNDRWAIELSYGSPLIVREERPDGLTRSLVLNMGLRYAF